MTLKTLSTRRLIQLGCAASAAASLAVGATGWWATNEVQRIDHEVLELNRVERELLGTLRDANELLLTSGSKSSREALKASLQTLQQTTQRPPAALVGTPQVQQLAELATPLAAFAALAKPSVENDDALVSYGKLSARAGEALGRLRAHAAEQALAAAAASRRVMLGAGVFALLAVALALACGRVMRLRLERRLGGELEVAQQLMQRVGAGDLRAIEMDAPPRSVIGALADMVLNLQTTIGAVHAGATQIQLASGEIAAGSSDLSQRTEGAAGSLQQTVSAIAQLSATVAHSAESAGQARELARGAADVAARGGSLVGQVVATMDEINGSSKRIAEITGVIDGIAFQTNILALNAAVEAARAGEQGRGFAVVASEVRSLAQRSAEAARQIKGLIGSSVDRVEAGTRLVGDAGRTMDEINSSVQRVADIIGEISAATAEQSSGIGQVSSAVVQLEHATQQNAALAEQSTAAAAGLSEQARTLSQAVGVFALPAAAA